MIGKINKIIIHGVGNKTFSEELKLSQVEISLTEKVKDSLSAVLSNTSFSDAVYQFFHESGELQLNPMYLFAERAFHDTVNLLENSCNIARQLYESSDHPKIQAGELMVVLFDDCEYRGEKCRALGLFKTEKRDTYFDFAYKNGSYSIIEQRGLNLGALEKGALIYDIERESGYCVSILMKANKQVDAKYWINDFLHITQSTDSFYKTQQIISLTKNYVKDVLSNDKEVSIVDKVEIVSRASDYLSFNESFNREAFCDEVFKDEKFKDEFQRYSEERDGVSYQLLDSFDLDKSLIKKKSRVLRSVIKLDKNFHIYVHGGEGLIKKGYDEDTGMEYYQLFFKKEE